MPSFKPYNCCIHYRLGIIQSMKHRNAYVITEEPCINGSVHRFKIQYGPNQWSPILGVIKKSDINKCDDLWSNVGRYGINNTFTKTSWLVTIKIILDLVNYTITFKRIGTAKKTFANYNLDKDGDYYFVIRWRTQCFTQADHMSPNEKCKKESKKIRFLQWRYRSKR